MGFSFKTESFPSSIKQVSFFEISKGFMTLLTDCDCLAPDFFEVSFFKITGTAFSLLSWINLVPLDF